MFAVLLAMLSGRCLHAANRSYVVRYSHANAAVTIHDESGAATAGGHLLHVHEGDLISVEVIDTLPGLFTITVSQTAIPDRTISAADLKTLGWVHPPATTDSTKSGEKKPEGQPLKPGEASVTNLKSAYADLSTKLDALDLTLRTAHFDAHYAEQLQAVMAARRTVASEAKADPADAAAVGKALAPATGLPAPTIEKQWAQLTTFLGMAPQTTGTISWPSFFTVTDKDMDLTIEIKPATDVFQAATIKAALVAVRLGYSFQASTTTGFAFSRLVDDKYTKDASKKLVHEHSDALSYEVALLLHVSPLTGSSWDRLAATAGVGLSSTAAGRVYLGLSWRLGRIGALSVGGVGGKVKVLRNGINHENVGDLTDTQLVEDRFVVRPFLALSLKVGS